MAKGFTIPVPVEKQQTGEQQLTVFAFSRSGKLMGNRDVSAGKAQFDNLDLPPSELRIFIVPKELPGVENIKTIESLVKLRAYEPVIGIEKDKIIIKPIPKQFFEWWKLRFCNVSGRVQKWFNLYGTEGYRPLCRARVHICEIDQLKLWLPNIPDYVIVRIPDIILKPEIPIRIPRPIPDPIGPVIGVNPLVKPLLTTKINLGLKGNAFDTFGETTVSADALKALPPISDTIKRQLTTRNVATIRKSLLDNFQLFHPYFCYHPWFWPYLYRSDELAVVYTDLNGRFDTTILYLEGGDKPDLYFWVEMMINGVWTTVYRPNVPCNTWWDYACGTEVTLNVTDPRVFWGCQQMLPGEIVWIKTIGHGASVSRIRQTPLMQPSNNTPAVNYQRIGMADFNVAGNYKNPFGSSIYFIVQFSSGLPKPQITYYKWKYCRTHNADMQVLVANPADADFTDLANPVSKSYTFEYIDPVTLIKHFDSKAVPLGPINVGPTQRLYRIPPTSPAMPPFNVPESSPFWDQNTYSMGIDTKGLPGDGLYEFRLELYNSAGVKVVNAPKSIYQVPHPANFTPSVVAPDVMQVLAAPAAVVSEGFDMRVRINNQKCEAAVYKIKLNGVEASPDCCGFVNYGDPDADIEIGFKAMHPHNHADFTFTVQKGTCSDLPMSAAANADGDVAGNVNGYVRDANGIYKKAFKPPILLGVCKKGGKGAFAEHVYVNALTIDGNQNLNGYDASALAAFALEP